MTQPIGILGGTFDPVHNGHLHLATTCLKELNLTELRFIPLNNPAHRPAPVASTEQRLEMLNLAIEDHSLLKVDDCELQRDEVSYTINTLKQIRGKIDETPLCMLIGMENFKTLNSWHQWKSLLDYAHIVIANRPMNDNESSDGVSIHEEMKNFMENSITQTIEDLHQQAAGLIFQLDIPMLDISSTQIKNNIRNNLNSASLLPNKVLDFIKTHHLYKK
ncbi:MAG: nicotinate-nucleotide adenylyltransferase [Gammaproteobacteria bacterium]|jgi:nicotinate-nucleotide adenylyltransferase